MSSTIGFAVFGRPDGLDYISNGLFQKAQLGNMMYLSGMTDDVILEKGENLAVIRQVTDQGGRPTGITVVALFEYAESFGDTNRPGGFVGSAVCFKGFPNPTILQKGLFAVLKAALTLVDTDTRKFLHPGKEHWKVNLPEASEKWFEESSTVHQSQLRSNTQIVVQIDGHPSFYLHAIAQGFLSNPEFNGVQDLLISSHKRVLSQWHQKSLKVFSPFRLLDYALVLGQLNNKLNDIRKETNEKKDESLRLETSIAEHNTDLKRLEAKEVHLSQRIKDLEQKNEYAQHAFDTEQAERLKHVQEARIRLEEIQSAQKQNFQTTVVNGPYRDALKSYVDEQVRPLERQAREEKEFQDANYFIIEKRLVQLVLFALGVMILTSLAIWGGLALYAKIAGGQTSTKPKTEKTAAQNEANQEKKEAPEPPKPIPAPEVLTINKIWDWTPQQREQHQAELRTYITRIDSIKKYEDDTASVRQFLTRKWHFTELFANHEDKDPSQVLLNRVESLYKRFGSQPNALSCRGCIEKMSFHREIDEKVKAHLGSLYFLLPKDKTKKAETKPHDFATIDRWAILTEYFKDRGNIYSQSGVEFDTQNPDSFLLQHFRWMVFHLSDHEVAIQKDLFPTVQKTHKVPYYTEK